MRERRATIGKWSKNPKDGVIPCSEKVEPGYFFGANGGYLLAQRRYRVGLDFDITMQIKPRNISGMKNYEPHLIQRFLKMGLMDICSSYFLPTVKFPNSFFSQFFTSKCF